jgi:hypothetical protein
MYYDFLLRLLHHFHQTPTLALAQRTALHDPHDIAYRALVLLVVSMEAGGLLYELTIDRVLHLPFNSYRDGLIHLVALYHPDPCFAQISFNHFINFLFGATLLARTG